MGTGLYIGIDGKARKVKGVYIGVSDKARKVKKIYVGDSNGKARVCYQSGKKLSEYTVGSTVYLNEYGRSAEYIVVHQGLPSALYDSSCRGTWLMRKHIYSTGQWRGTDINDYKASKVNTDLNDSVLRSFDVNVQNVIKNVKIPYVAGTGSSGTVQSGENGLAVKVFLPSNREIGFSTDHEDGYCLSYFNGKQDSDRIAYFDGAAMFWWTRSPYKTDTTNVRVVNYGGSSTISYCANTWGIRPMIVLPSDTIFDEKTKTFLA